MQQGRDSVLDRLLVRLLARGQGEVRARQDVAHLKGVLRFTLLFGVTVIVPAVMLTYFAIRSLHAEEILIEQEIANRAQQVAGSVYRDLETTFTRFEDATLSRLAEGESPVSNLAEQSPYLRAAFRLERGETLAAPFVLPEPTLPVDPTAAYLAEVRRARALERQGAWLEAGEAYAMAAQAALHPQHAGEASFSRARMLIRAGRSREAEQALAGVYEDYANVRDLRGVRLGDLALLQRAKLRLGQDPELGAVVLESFLDDILAARWVIGRPAESAVAREVLGLLEGRLDPDKLARARTRLNERSSQLLWAERQLEELELFSGTAQRTPHGQFRYYPRSEANSLWATLWWHDDLYLFSFHYDSLHRDLRAAAEEASTLDSDIAASIVTVGDELPSTVSARETLQPWMAPLLVAVGPADPEALVAKKAQQRRIRVAVILLAVGMTTVGVIGTAVLVGRELETARMKADFAANVSHELRSPITQIRLKAEALILDLVFDDADRVSHYETIMRESERLSRLVDNVLDFSAIERGVKRYQMRPEDLGEIIHNAVEANRNDIESRGMTVEVDVPDDLPVIWCDRDAIGQVMNNLVSNAAKYGADGKWIGVRARVGLDGLDVCILDRGIGIRPEDKGLIFEHFYRSADPSVRKRKGTGIGLTIVRYIVDAHGGTITVDSAPGQGTTFTITFPLEPPPGAGA